MRTTRHSSTVKILTPVAVVFFFFMVAWHGDLVMGRTHAAIRTTVQFPHEHHVDKEISCDSCHHVYVDGVNTIEDEDLGEKDPREIRCASCHDAKQDSRYGLRDAVHLKCLGCHREIEKQGQKAGPRLCGQCHPWK